MRRIALAAIVVAVGLPPVAAQQTSPNMQNEADKGIKTQNSGASGYVGEQDRPGSAAQMPGSSSGRADSTTTAPSAQNSGTGIAGAPGSTSGPSPKGTVGQNTTTQQQDSSNIKGLPGNKSGPPAKR
ncbi:hypothetical protein JEY40_33475 [Bradyrhizobium japonicum]|uniref:hypothetical protein n=1 Tax=Bradyrhizobium japonicum TaxID=375 RepID=UPI0009B8EBD9|nr:hypothetical protein [Bradyrhizobium japonicum]MCW2345354.1 hypothetical protein [Bradyrhizobium japonicum]UQD70784.1 hypothetical protein JEY40_33475 [Bradyrhizobium japonicum]